MIASVAAAASAPETINLFQQVAYLVGAVCFVLALKWMSGPTTARRGLWIGISGMTIAVLGTLTDGRIQGYEWIIVAIVIGAAIGIPMAVFMPMTAMPQRTALSHAFGALAAALVGTAEYYRETPHGFVIIALVVETLLGFLTFTGSLMAFGKLQEILPTRPLVYKGQHVVHPPLSTIAA